MRVYPIYCPECSRELTGVKGGECPECGTEFDAEELAMAAVARHAPLWRILVQVSWPPLAAMTMWGLVAAYGPGWMQELCGLAVPVVCAVNAIYLSLRVAPALVWIDARAGRNAGISGFAGCMFLFVVAQLLVIFLSMVFGCVLSGFGFGPSGGKLH